LKDGGGVGWTGTVDQRVKNKEALHSFLFFSFSFLYRARK